MTTSMLFYKNVAPINKKRHASWAITPSEGFGFTRGVNSVPITALEFPSASKEFAIVFAKSEEGVMPIVVLGVRNGENLFIDQTGKWLANYVPAFVRRYPFVFSTADDGNTLTLCLDEDYEGCSAEGHGERLFNDEGENTPYLDKVVEFLRDYQNNFRRTQAFGHKLEKLDLLEPMGAQFKTPDGQNGSLNGFFIVSREKLKKLSTEQLIDLVNTDELEVIYLHLNSLQNLRDTIRRLPSGKEATKPVTA